MGQRLGIASALLADPELLILDEPVNGLDPDGIRWIRTLLKSLAAEGRTIFLSSHLMSEMAATADHVIVIGQGKLLRDLSMADFIAEETVAAVTVRSPQSAELSALLKSNGVTVHLGEGAGITVEGLTSEEIGTLAAGAQITLFELTPQIASLEDAYMKLTENVIDFHGKNTRQGANS